MIRRLFMLATVACSPHAGLADTVQDGRNACLAAGELYAGTEVNWPLLSRANRCTGITDGVVQVMIYNCELAPDAFVPKANPPPSTVAAIQAFLNWADAHPERWGESFADGMMAAIMETFPCEK